MLETYLVDNLTGQWWFAFTPENKSFKVPIAPVVKNPRGEISERVSRALAQVLQVHVGVGNLKYLMGHHGHLTASSVLGRVGFRTSPNGRIRPSHLVVDPAFNYEKFGEHPIWNKIQSMRANEPEDAKTMSNTYVVVTGASYAWFSAIVLANTIEEAVALAMPQDAF